MSAVVTELSTIDGQAGRLEVRGRPLEQLAGRLDYESMAALLWAGLTGDSDSGEALVATLAEARVRLFPRLVEAGAAGVGLPPVAALRLGLAGLGAVSHHQLVASIPVILAVHQRLSQGASPIAPRNDLGTTADFLRMYSGSDPAPEAVAALEAYLVTVAEHGLNASTYTARVIASTQAGVSNAVIGALCALEGPLHGGAPGPVLDLLDSLAATPDPAELLRSTIRSGGRLMGFGHRVYKTRDPRAEVLCRACQRLDSPRLQRAQAIEQLAVQILDAEKPGRNLRTNVEFYTALLLEALGFRRDSFTAIFALGRVLGWVAHSVEQARTGRLIRPVQG